MRSKHTVKYDSLDTWLAAAEMFGYKVVKMSRGRAAYRKAVTRNGHRRDVMCGSYSITTNPFTQKVTETNWLEV
ncbi:hypothetical protein [Alteromonas mediterranea]|uniref:Uncharacterized protein n=1 Tax=Alteromonas mediterranea (strain DSM 17117 / CIP 110805 / LMG 28347 / Deep ecotype) TaxID=1774373 RepID=F2GCE4_ALTMD|nr:hypothetical protein [Alteromonas mediterranea]AEA99100.1 hypothetical protein MADE_1014830 [Alteromonas mediterranea DE]